MAHRIVDENSLKTVADAIREKAGTSDSLIFPTGFAEAIAGIQAGGGSAVKKDVNFYDCEGTLLYSYTLEEAQAMTELPKLPERKGLVCQGWNWELSRIKELGRAVDVGAMYTTDDGKTRVYITLQEGRTSPMLGLYVRGNVTVDWGDGSTPDVLAAGTRPKAMYTPTHHYKTAGDYVITLDADSSSTYIGTGSASEAVASRLLRNSSDDTDPLNCCYNNAITGIETGKFIYFNVNACSNLTSLSYLVISPGSNSTNIGKYAFNNCYSLPFVVIPYNTMTIGDYAFNNCCSLESVITHNDPIITNGNASIGSYAFNGCRSLSSVIVSSAMDNSSYGSQTHMFSDCQSLSTVVIHDGQIGNSEFYGCRSLTSVTITDTITNIADNAFYDCCSLRYFDFSKQTVVPTLAATTAFTGTPADLQFRVPAALYDEWIAATNWSTYASQIVAV